MIGLLPEFPATITYVPLDNLVKSRKPLPPRSSSIGVPNTAALAGAPPLNHVSKLMIGAITAFVLVAIGTKGALIPIYKVVLSGAKTIPSAAKPLTDFESTPIAALEVKSYPFASPQEINSAFKFP